MYVIRHIIQNNPIFSNYNWILEIIAYLTLAWNLNLIGSL